MCGLFPSNFVEVLDESFRPSSPLPGRTGGGSISRAASPNPDAPKAKSKSVFRKPFQAYAAAGSPNPEAARRDSQRSSGASDLGTPRGSVKNSHKPYSAMKRTSNERSSNGSVRETPRSPLVLSRQNSNLGSFRAASPAPPRLHSRAVSPAPPRSHSRAVSPSPYDQYTSRSRTASPLPAAFGDPDFHSRAPSPAAFPNAGSSPPPPPPPPHRVAYQPSRVPSPEPFHNNGYNQQSAIPPSPTRSNCSPSPLTQAMNGVMDSLQDMSMRGNRSSSPPNNPGDPSLGIWSPEAFDQIYASSARKARPATSVGVGMKHKDSGYGSIDDLEDESRGGPPQLSNYVQRMESRLRQMHQQEDAQREDVGPPPPRKNSPYEPMQRPQSFYLAENEPRSISRISHKLSKRKSAYELGRAALNRTFTHKSSSTNATSSTQHSLMSGSSAGAFSATSAGSLARRKFGFSKETDSEASGPSRARPSSAMNWQDKNGSLLSLGATSGMHDSRAGAASAAGFVGGDDFSTGAGLLGGLAAPSPKKRGFLKKLVDGAKTGAASARSTISSSGDISGRMSRNGRPQSRAQSAMGRPSGMLNGITGIAGGTAAPRTASGDAARDMGLGGGMDWVQTRRDVNRSNTLSRNERQERSERAQMLDLPALAPVDILEEDVEGDEGLDGLAVPEPTDFVGSINLNLVDKSARFVANLPVGLTAAALAQGYVCRPYRSDVQRLRAIFTWVSERIGWEEEYDVDVGQPVDTRQIVQSMRGSTKEIAHLVAEMCAAVGLGVEVVHGYLKTPGEELAESMENATVMHPNHWWNAVLVDGEWRIMDAALANPSNPKRGLYSVCPSTQAEGWYFLTRPMESCYTHVPGLDEFQHIVPLMDKGILLALPGACPPYFKHGLRLVDYDTSLLFLENLEMAQIQVESPEDVECVAELEVREFARDMDGDFFESGEVIKKPALCQAEWYGGIKRWIIKAVLPGDEGRAVLKIYAGKRGLMVSYAHCLNLFSSEVRS